ncbi:MAG: Mini-ribonuclease 3 [Ruminococcaceae bacterium]|nr:Mini-ribonuclease 3 [Oscillospiraceae bacterium]
MTKNEANQLPVASLAYLGDSVLEIMVRKKLILDKKGDVHSRSHCYVTAVSQANAAERLMSVFTDDELAVYKRGRNHTHSSPKSATHAQYSRATGLECVFAYLYLTEDTERLEYIFRKGFEEQ